VSKIKILHTLCRINSGGVEQRRLLLARGLPKDRYEHQVICQDTGGALPSLLRAEGWQIHEIGKAPHILSPSWHGAAWQIAKDFKPDVIHGAVIEGVALANGIGMRFHGLPVISEETSDPINRSWRGNMLMRAMCLRSKVAIGVSPAVGEYLRSTAKLPRRKVRVINNAVSPAPTVSDNEIARRRSNFGFSRTDFVIGSVGRVVDEHKRFSDLIRAVRILHEIGLINTKLIIIGDGPDHVNLKRLVQECSLNDHVVFAGYQGEARRLYPLMDVFALASAHEAFGLVLAEAMMAGVPVVATRVGGIPHVLDQGNAGRLVPPLEPGAMADEIGKLIQDADTRQKLGDAGRKYAESHFSAERYCWEIDELYTSLVQ
jgi:glycosyltransferase involved in cell wall biosynthesis